MRPTSPETTPRVRLADAGAGLGAIRRQLGDPVRILLGLVALVLLVVCANIANLLLARAVAREKEVALRVSLGCGRARLVRQLFTESLLLAAIGGALSLPVAAALGTLMPNLMPFGGGATAFSFELDARSLAGTAAVTLLAALLFGLYPAWRASRLEAVPALKEGGGGAGGVSRANWTPARVLVLAQMSLGLLLVTAAILFTSQLNDVVNRETGFERGHVLLFGVRPGEVGHQGERLRQFYFELERRLGDIAGVEAVGLARNRPMRGGGYWDRISSPGATKPAQSALHHGNAAFLEALGVPLAAGRIMTAQEAAAGAKVAVISEGLARALELASPLGTLISVGGDEHEVIGVARQARYSHMEEAPSVTYLPFGYGRQAAAVVIRTSVSPLTVLASVREAVREIDRDLPLVEVRTMEQQISRTLQRERLFAWLCGSFGVLAMVLCVVGLYGLMSHTTARRTPEIGVRMALGATPGDVTWKVLREAMSLTGAGLALGVPVVWYAVGLAEKHGVLVKEAAPYSTLGAAIGALAVAALVAALAPALRAAAVDPMDSLRA